MAGGEGVAGDVRPGLAVAARWHEEQAEAERTLANTPGCTLGEKRLHAQLALEHRMSAAALRALAVQVAPGGEEG